MAIQQPQEKFHASIEAEEDVLSCLLQNAAAIKPVAETLKPEHFYRDAHATIYKAFLSLYQQKRRCTFENVIDELERQEKLQEVGGRAFLQSLQRVYHSLEDVEDAAPIVIRKAKTRELKYALLEMYHKADAEDDDAVEFALERISNVAIGINAEDIMDFSTVVDEYFADFDQRCEDLANGNVRGIPTGFPDLDRLMGGFHPSKLYTLGALTGGGKSAWALNVALHMALRSSKRVYFASLEMTPQEIVERAISVYIEMDQAVLRDATMGKQDREALKQKIQALKRCAIKLDDHSYTINDLCNNVKRVHARTPLDMVIVDYLQLLETAEGTTSKRNGNRAQEVADLSRRLKRLAMELEVPVLALVQLNRAVENRTMAENREGTEVPIGPKLSDINESGGIARDSNVVMFIYSVESEISRREQSMPYNVYVKVAKNRSGRIGQVSLVFSPRITKFRDPVQEDAYQEDVDAERGF